LIKKLEYCGVRCVALDLLVSYLKNRTQVVRIDEFISDPIKGKCGVPQETVLGPVLFLIYINGLVNLKISGNIICFADDTLVLIDHKNIDGLYNLANHCINDIKTWLDNNFLELNIKKSKYMYFSINKSKVQFKNIIVYNLKI